MTDNHEIEIFYDDTRLVIILDDDYSVPIVDLTIGRECSGRDMDRIEETVTRMALRLGIDIITVDALPTWYSKV